MSEMEGHVARAMLEHLRHCTDVSGHSDGTKNVGLEDAWINLDRLAAVAIVAYREFEETESAKRFGPNWRMHMAKAFEQLERRR